MSDSPETRLSLLLRLRDRTDGEAWSRFVDLYGPLVYGLARRRGLGDADAADRMQEVLLAVSRGVERYDPSRGPFRKWLHTVAMNKIRSFWKRQGREPETGADLEAVADTADPDERWELEYRQRLFAAAVERVRPETDPTHWRVFWLAAVEAKPGAVVAAECGVKVEQVYVIRQRVRQKIAAIIAEFEEE
jgi:RNA polymerase sigma factor (sigma-70 family)